MYVKKNFTLQGVLAFSWFHIVWISVWSIFVASIFYFIDPDWLDIPWLPISIVATAVAFYIGFKNNSSYDRLWEARKIWGAIINSSRMWGATVRSYVSNQFDSSATEQDLKEIHRILLYRHIAYLYILRSQLLIPTEWEHVNQSKFVRRLAEKRMKEVGVGLYNDDELEPKLEKYLEEVEMKRIINYKNSATQLIDQQSQHLQMLRKQDKIDDFRHMELQKILNDFYTHQGKAERIKKFPFPRQYGGTSFILVAIFIFLVPFGFASEFSKLGANGVWLSVPFSILVSWIYIIMELVGDYSENPFEGMGNDIPMLSLCRTIEIDLLEMLDEDEIPAAIQAKNGVIM